MYTHVYITPANAIFFIVYDNYIIIDKKDNLGLDQYYTAAMGEIKKL